MKRESFDATAAYWGKINPLLKKLVEACQFHGVPLTVVMTHKMEVTDTDESAEGAGAIYGTTSRMSPLQLAIAELMEMPEETREKFIEVILLASAAIESGGSASVHLGVVDDKPQPDSRWN